MARSGEMIMNLGTGELIRFVTTSAMSDDRCLEFELEVAPLGRVGGVPHKHEASERFTVHTGELSCWLGLRRRVVEAGESLEIPAGVTHYVVNDTEQPVKANVQVCPARDFETFFETMFAIGVRRRFKAFRGLPPPLQFALLAHTYGIYAPGLPIAVQKPLLSGLAALARRRGYPAAIAAPSALDGSAQIGPG